MKKLTALILTTVFLLSSCAQNEQLPENSTSSETAAASEATVIEESVNQIVEVINEYDFTEEDKEEILNALQAVIEKYKNGEIVNDELEPRFNDFPPSCEYPEINSADDFEIYLSAGDMYLCYVPFVLEGTSADNYRMEFRLNRAGASALAIGAGNAKEGDIFWVIDSVGIFKIDI